MKQPKSPKPVELKDHAGYAAAQERLTQLDSKLAETLLRRDGHKILQARLSPEGRLYLGRSPKVLPSMTEQVFDDVVAKVIMAGDVTPQLLARLRSQISKPQISDSYDSEIILEIEETEVTLLLLKRAVTLHKAESSRQKAAAIAAIINSVQTERDGIARLVAASFLELAAALRDERELIDRLRIQDESIPDLLSPPPFPVQSLCQAPVLAWVALALNEKSNEVETWLNEATPREIANAAE